MGDEKRWEFIFPKDRTGHTEITILPKIRKPMPKIMVGDDIVGVSPMVGPTPETWRLIKDVNIKKQLENKSNLSFDNFHAIVCKSMPDATRFPEMYNICYDLMKLAWETAQLPHKHDVKNKCVNKNENGNCPLHNLHCQYPDCEK